MSEQRVDNSLDKPEIQSFSARGLESFDYNAALKECIDRFPDTEAFLRAKGEMTLLATNRIRREIDSGEMDNMSAEEAFHHIHQIHVGQTPEEHIIAVANLGLGESFGPLAFEADLELAASLLNGDSSFEFGAYRTKPFFWLERNRGIFGIYERDLKVFAGVLFTKVDRAIAQIKEGALGQLNDQPWALYYSTALATLIDIAHFKRDANGRAQEDWAVWLQRQLLKTPNEAMLVPPKFISDSGLRVRSLYAILKPEFEETSEEQQKRIFKRNGLVLKIRQRMYSRLAAKLGISEEELDERLQAIDKGRRSFLPETHRRWKQEGKRVYGLGTNVFYDLLNATASEGGDLLGDFGDLGRFIQRNGKEKFRYLEADEVFKESDS